MTGLVRTSLLVVAIVAALAAAAAFVPSRDEPGSDRQRTASASPATKRVRRAAAVRRREAATPTRTPEDAASRLDVAPDGTFAATGRVVAADGSPIRGAEIQLRGAGGQLRATRSDGDGAFRLEFVVSPCGESAVRVAAWAPQRVATATPWTMTVRGRARDFGTIVLADAERIAGRVVNGVGDPVPSAALSARPMEGVTVEDWSGFVAPIDSSVWRTGADGAFEIWLPRGTWRLRVSPEGRCDWWGGDRVVATGADDVVLTIPMEHARQTLRRVVRATDERGAPLLRFRATLRAWEASAGDSAHEGVATLELVESPPFQLVVSSTGREAVVLDGVERLDEEIVVRLPREPRTAARPTIRGVVEYAGREAPYGWTVEAIPADGVGRTSSCTNSAGRFQIDAPGTGPCRVAVQADVATDAETTSVAGSATAWPGDADVRVVARPLAPLVVEFVLDDGVVADEGSAHVVDERPGGASWDVRFDRPSQRVVVADVPADAVCRVEARARRGADWLRGVVTRFATPGGAPAVARFERGGVISGVVVREDGSPVAAAVVVNVADNPHGWTYWTDVGGRFRFTSMNGSFERLRATAPGLEQQGDVLAESDGAPVRIVMAARKP